ncbi:MAG: 4Fe-4S binding protein [Halanaerobiaceae bacterium]
MEVCEVGAITINDESFMIDQEICENCGVCFENCPSEAIEEIKENEE